MKFVFKINIVTVVHALFFFRDARLNGRTNVSMVYDPKSLTYFEVLGVSQSSQRTTCLD